MQVSPINSTISQNNSVLGTYERNEFASNHGIEALLKVPDVFEARGIISQQEWDLLEDDQKKLLLQQAGIDPNRYIEVYNARKSAEAKISDLSEEELAKISTLQDVYQQEKALAIEKDNHPSESNILYEDTTEVQSSDSLVGTDMNVKKSDTLPSGINEKDIQDYLAAKADIDNEISKEMANNPDMQAEKADINSTVSAEDQKRINEEIALLANNRDLASSGNTQVQSTNAQNKSNPNDKKSTPIILPVNLADGEKTAAFIMSGYQPREEVIQNAEDKAKNGDVKDSETWVATIIRKLILSLKD